MIARPYPQMLFRDSPRAASAAVGRQETRRCVETEGGSTVFDLALQVLGWQRDQRPVWLARVVSVTGMGSNDPAAAAALTAGQPPAGTVLSGAADSALRDAVAEAGVDGGGPRLLDLRVEDAEAVAVGLTCGGQASVLLQPAADLPETVWGLLASRTPVALVTDLDGPLVGQTTWLTVGGGGDDPVARTREVVTIFGRGTPESAVVEVEDRRLLVTALWPTPRLVIVGEGLIANALAAACQVLSWQPSTVNDTAAATDAVAALGPGDGVVVLSHDRNVDAPVLAAALSSAVGYLAALGSRRTQAARAGWLADHGVTADEIGRVRGPAGLDIGARTPAEIAVAIVAEMIAVRSGATGSPLAGRDGPIHHDGLHAPPARYPTGPQPA
jgi:xanthine dehydrogenase accessory factor